MSATTAYGYPQYRRRVQGWGGDPNDHLVAAKANGLERGRFPNPY
jgi:hypothetical protein